MSSDENQSRQETEESVNQGQDAEFEAAFAEFAAPDKEPPTDKVELKDDADEKPEGNAPDDEAGADKAPAKEGEESTSGKVPDGADDKKAPADEAAPKDIWANAAPELLAARVEMEKQIEALRHSDNSQKHRVAALSRKLNELTSGGGKQPEVKESEPTEAEKALDAKLDAMSKDYPDIGETLKELRTSLKAELAPLKEATAIVAATTEEERIGREVEALSKAHPDWRDIAATPDWAGWAEAQPEGVQRLANSINAREVSVAISLFKQEKGMATKAAEVKGGEPEPKPEAKADAKRQQQLEGGKDVRSRPAPATSGPPDDFEGSFAYYEQRRLQKKAAGAR